jgi:hypothetical protein
MERVKRMYEQPNTFLFITENICDIEIPVTSGTAEEDEIVGGGAKRGTFNHERSSDSEDWPYNNHPIWED